MMLPRERLTGERWDLSRAKELGFSVAAIGLAIRLSVGADSPYIPYYVGLIIVGLLCPLLVKVRNGIVAGSATSSG
jgi:hypothetical protein